MNFTSCKIPENEEKPTTTGSVGKFFSYLINTYATFWSWIRTLSLSSGRLALWRPRHRTYILLVTERAYYNLVARVVSYKTLEINLATKMEVLIGNTKDYIALVLNKRTGFRLSIVFNINRAVCCLRKKMTTRIISDNSTLETSQRNIDLLESYLYQLSNTPISL